MKILTSREVIRFYSLADSSGAMNLSRPSLSMLAHLLATRRNSEEFVTVFELLS